MRIINDCFLTKYQQIESTTKPQFLEFENLGLFPSELLTAKVSVAASLAIDWSFQVEIPENKR